MIAPARPSRPPTRRPTRRPARRRPRRPATIGLACLLGACTVDGLGAPPGTTATTPRPAAVAPPDVASTRPYRNIAVPFPAGDWTLVGEVVDTRDAAPPQRQAVWASDAGGVIDRLVTVRHEPRPPRSTFAPFAGCTDARYPHAAVYRNARDDQACWHVRPVSLGLAGEPPALHFLIAEFAERRDLVLPPTMIGVRFVATRDAGRHAIEYLFNADLLAPAAGRRLWRPADWTAAAVARDPRRRGVVAAFRDWGERWSIAALPPPGS